MTSPLLSVLLPVYNEERTVGEILERVATGPYPHPQKEVIVIDDGSQDRTASILAGWDGRQGVQILRHPANRGKGSAVRTGLARVRGAITIIQDADLEYDPEDYPLLVERIRHDEALVVYGSRYLEPSAALPWTKYRLAVVVLNHLVQWLYGQRLTDEATCYKAFRTDILQDLDLEAERFELCAEMTAKLCLLNIPIVEVPIVYRPRSAAEGKKIGWRDAWQTLTTLLKWRLARFPRPRPHDVPREASDAVPLPTSSIPLAAARRGKRWDKFTGIAYQGLHGGDVHSRTTVRQ